MSDKQNVEWNDGKIFRLEDRKENGKWKIIVSFERSGKEYEQIMEFDTEDEQKEQLTILNKYIKRKAIELHKQLNARRQDILTSLLFEGKERPKVTIKGYSEAKTLDCTDNN
jgi:hypothetical protein